MRNIGLMVHNTTKPLRKDTKLTEIRREVEEKQIDERTILRRTTIEEIEIRKNDDDK